MAASIGTPVPDGDDRRAQARARRDASNALHGGRGTGVTVPNGEEVDYGLGFPANYHKSLPHDVDGAVDRAAYLAMVAALVGQQVGAAEALPVGDNRSGSGGVGDPPAFTTVGAGLGRRKLTSPFTGHLFDLEGADAAALAQSAPPRLDTDELAAEMAELYAMALLRDVPFTAIDDGTGAGVGAVVDALDGMPWFDGSYEPVNQAERRRYAGRAVVQGGPDLFRGSTPGAKNGPWLSQYMLVGNGTDGANFDPASSNPPGPDFRGTNARFGPEDGFVLFGSQVIDQRSIVAKEGVDYMTNWAAWLDAQNGVDFVGLDVLRTRRRYLTTPRDIASYVRVDALYQAYLVACLVMLSAPAFPRDRGLPESSSRTRSAFSTFGGPHVLSLLTEVATRGLKAVWRQKWLHHRRARPEVVAALLTLRASQPGRVTDPRLAATLDGLRERLPQGLLDDVAAHNTAQNGTSAIQPVTELPPDFPEIDDNANFLLPMAFPEGSPTHPAYGAGHATVAGACVTILKAFFEMFEEDGATERAWPLPAFVARFTEGAGGNANEGGELVPAPEPASPLTVQGELDKLAANVSIARNMAGVHYYSDYVESLRLGERVAVSILEEQAATYGERVSMSFTSFDGDAVRVSGHAGAAFVDVDAGGVRIPAASWYGRYAA